MNGDHLTAGDNLWAPGGDGHHLAAYDGERNQLAHGGDGNHLQTGSDSNQLADGGDSNKFNPDCDGNGLEASDDGTQLAHGDDLDAGGTQLAPSGDYSQRGTSGDGVQFDQPTFCHPVVARFRHADVVVWPSYFNLECVHFHHDL